MKDIVPNEDPQWYAIYVRAKCEKLVVEILERKGVEAYVPLRTVIRVYSKQKRKKLLPLISSYVFVRIVRGQYVSVLETEKVLQFVRIGREMIAIPQTEIDVLKLIVGDVNLDVDLYQRDFKEGDKIEVVSGSLAGVKGVLKKIRSQHQFVVELETIGQKLMVTVKSDMVAGLG